MYLLCIVWCTIWQQSNTCLTPPSFAPCQHGTLSPAPISFHFLPTTLWFNSVQGCVNASIMWCGKHSQIEVKDNWWKWEMLYLWQFWPDACESSCEMTQQTKQFSVCWGYSKLQSIEDVSLVCVLDYCLQLYTRVLH